MSPLRSVGFIALFLVQIFPAATVAWQQTQRLHGRPAMLAVTTRDPRDLFRGEYSTLSYEIGRLQGVAVAGPIEGCDLGPHETCNVKEGRKVYVRLVPDGSGIARATEVSFERPPANDLFIAGKLGLAGTLSRTGVRLAGGPSCEQAACFSGTITYGIETWYGAQGRPAELDAAARKDVRVMVRLAPDGTAVLDGIDMDGKAFARTPRLW